MGGPLRAGLTPNVCLSCAANAAASTCASRLLIPQAAARTPFGARALSTAAKIPPAGGGHLRYIAVACLVGGAVTVALFLLPESTKHADILHEGELAESIDWSLLPGFPAVAHPSYNTFCKCCWAVIAVKSIQATFVVEKGFTHNLSIQQVIDCAAIEGCCGNNLDRAYKYITRVGLTTEEAYPGFPSRDRSFWYGLLRGYCKMEGKPVVARINGHVRVLRTEESLMRALQRGPVAVYVNINWRFRRYHYGILQLFECPPSAGMPPDKHVLLVVGYGTDAAGRKYWKLMNTWGPTWGEKGYVRFARNGHPDGVAGMMEINGFRPSLRN